MFTAGKRRLRAAGVSAVAALSVATSFAGIVLQSPAAKAAPTSPPVTGAAFTTVNETADGTGRCKNGSPNTNCNIYDGKQYVWLNGGPDTAYVGNGTYFFAVLEPGGQADPNDGGAKNLSDGAANGDYTTRTFSVTGGVVTYAKPPGTHDLDLKKIRLMPYDNSSNGVYILAICSLGLQGTDYPADASKCKYDAFKVQEGDITLAPALAVTKDAAGTDKNTYTWGITKAVDQTTVKQVGGTATFNYTVTATHDLGTITDVEVTGTISVFNTNVDAGGVTVPVTGVNVTDQLSNGVICTVTGGVGVTASAFETDFAYSCPLAALPTQALTNTVTATWPSQFLDNGAFLEAASADFIFTPVSFTENAVDECATVTDSYAGTLGTACVSDANPKSFTYSRTINVAPGCVSYPNTATSTTNDTGVTATASKTVQVCGPSQTGALTIGFWKGPNGNSLIQNYCGSGTTGLAAYLSGLGGSGGPFADASGKSCTQLVTYVNGIIVGASATNMNTMLKAQMLATALDVYFSDPARTALAAVGKTKPPSTFLAGGSLGSFIMDLTAVCPMVDSTTTGTATCSGAKPSTNAFASGAFTAASMSVQAILTYEATSPSPYSAGVWYAGNRTLEEIAKNVFDQINNQLAFTI